jgi:carboxymethylenebutenolidase
MEKCMMSLGVRRWLPLLGLALAMAACGGADNNDSQADAARDNVDAMSREHAGDTATPSPAADIAPGRAVVAERLPYAEVGEELVYGHFVFPADMVEPLPAVIVIHEWWGLNEGVEAMADRIAAEGYIVLAVDLFGGKTAESPADARDLMLKVVENPQPANENLRQAFQFVRETAGAPRIASLGWCFGGGWSLNAALQFPDEINAAVIYYGQVTDDDERLQPLNVPLLGIFAADDRGIPVASVREFQAALERLRKPFEIRVFDGVGHAFANPTGNNYDAKAADEAWELTTGFLRTHLHPAAD